MRLKIWMFVYPYLIPIESEEKVNNALAFGSKEVVLYKERVYKCHCIYLLYD